MKRENSQLRQQLAATTQILSALRSGHEVSRILQALQDQEDLATIAQRFRPSIPSAELKRSSSIDSLDTAMSCIPSHEGASSPSTPAFAPTNSSKVSSPDSLRGSYFAKSPTRKTDASSQTTPYSITQSPSGPKTICELRSNACRGPTSLTDHRLIKHLFSVYWVWVHPNHKILDMNQFVMGYETGVETYCSLYLIYAVCIAACKHLDPAWENLEGKYTDVAALRQNLLAEARSLKLAMSPSQQCRADIQASAILSFAAPES